jgi:hypothetical protein
MYQLKLNNKQQHILANLMADHALRIVVLQTDIQFQEHAKLYPKSAANHYLHPHHKFIFNLAN